MAYNEHLANRIREIVKATGRTIEEKKMFGGLCFMVNQKMCVGVEKHRLMVRMDPAKYEESLEKPGVHLMEFTGRPMKGYVFVDVDVLSSKEQLDYWMSLALEFNKIARPSKAKK